MAKGRMRSQWEQTSLLAAIFANPYRDTEKHKASYQPWEFNPFETEPPASEPKKKIKISVQCLKGFCDAQKREGKS